MADPMKEKKLKAIKKIAKGMGMPLKEGKDIEYKAMGGNVAKYYGKGGKVAGCGPAQNKS
jgi:hypothetical protein